MSENQYGFEGFLTAHELQGQLQHEKTRANSAEAERDQLRRDLESLQDSLDEQHEVPEPDATNPDHLRFAANLVEDVSNFAWSLEVGRDDVALTLSGEADRLDAARSAEREREQHIEQFISILADCGVVAHTSSGLDNLRQAGEKLMSAGLLRGGGRGE